MLSDSRFKALIQILAWLRWHVGDLLLKLTHSFANVHSCCCWWNWWKFKSAHIKFLLSIFKCTAHIVRGKNEFYLYCSFFFGVIVQKRWAIPWFMSRNTLFLYCSIWKPLGSLIFLIIRPSGLGQLKLLGPGLGSFLSPSLVRPNASNFTYQTVLLYSLLHVMLI